MSARLPSGSAVRTDPADGSATLTPAVFALDGGSDYVLSTTGAAAAELEVDGAGDYVLTPTAGLTPGSARGQFLKLGAGDFILH